jgi:hypothetical protein
MAPMLTALMRHTHCCLRLCRVDTCQSSLCPCRTVFSGAACPPSQAQHSTTQHIHGQAATLKSTVNHWASGWEPSSQNPTPHTNIPQRLEQYRTLHIWLLGVGVDTRGRLLRITQGAVLHAWWLHPAARPSEPCALRKPKLQHRDTSKHTTCRTTLESKATTTPDPARYTLRVLYTTLHIWLLGVGVDTRG